jgi:hypothetical protein
LITRMIFGEEYRAPTNAQLQKRPAVQFYSLHRHVSATLVTIFRVSYSKNTNNTLVIAQNA